MSALTHLKSFGLKVKQLKNGMAVEGGVTPPC